MNPISTEIDADVAHELSEGLCRVANYIRWGIIRRYQKQGLTAEQIAAKSPRASVRNVQNCERAIELMLEGILPSTPSKAERTARAYKCLRDYGSLPPTAHDHVVRCLDLLAEVNPQIRVHEPYQPGAMRHAGSL